MNDMVAIQYALYRGLRSVQTFRDTNIVLGREFIAAKVAQDAAWQTPSPSGKQGVGMIVQIPSLVFPKPNSLQRQREFSIGIFEEPNFNWDSSIGTLTGADDWGDQVIDFLWNWRLWRASGLILQDKAIVPDTRFADAGIIGVRAVCYLRQERQPVERAATPTITANGFEVSLAVTDGSDIYYTTDGFSTPAPDNDGSLPGEQAAVKYSAPFTVDAGTRVLTAAYATGVNPSQVADSLIS